MDCNVLSSLGEIKENKIEIYVKISRNLHKHDLNSEIMNKLQHNGIIISQHVLNNSGLIPDNHV